jgi:hypothetical protein
VRDRSFDEDRPLADVAPAEAQGLPRTKTGMREPFSAGATLYVLETSPRSFLPIPSHTMAMWR